MNKSIIYILLTVLLICAIVNAQQNNTSSQSSQEKLNEQEAMEKAKALETIVTNIAEIIKYIPEEIKKWLKVLFVVILKCIAQAKAK